MSEFYEIEPSLENYWRAVILFGRNVASYKFALAKSLYDLKAEGNTVITLDQLAQPFSQHICEHLKLVDKQATSSSSKFLDFCRSYNAGEIDQQTLITKTVQYGSRKANIAYQIAHDAQFGFRFWIQGS